MKRDSSARATKPLREVILDGAEAIVADLGAGHLSMDAVAKCAGVSKGGLLHHFPTKIDLIQGMLDRLLSVFENDVETIQRIAEPSLKGHLRAWIRLIQTIDTQLDRISAALLAASANQPELLAPFAKMMQNRNARYREEGAGFGPALVLLTALDGYWLFNALNINPISPKETTVFFAALHALVDDLP